MLVAVPPHLPAGQRAAVLAQAGAAATAIPRGSSRAVALSALAPHLPPTCWPRRWPLPPPSPKTSPVPRRWARWRPTCPPPSRPPSWPRHWPLPPPSPTTIPASGRWSRWRLTCPPPSRPPSWPRHWPPPPPSPTTTPVPWQWRAGAYLPAGLLAQALATAIAITSDYSRVQALGAMASHLPADLLAQALAATPKTSPETVTALVERSQITLARDADDVYVALLRDSLNGTSRSVCIDVITAAAPRIAEIGGTCAIEQCVNAFTDVYRWWP